MHNLFQACMLSMWIDMCTLSAQLLQCYTKRFKANYSFFPWLEDMHASQNVWRCEVWCFGTKAIVSLTDIELKYQSLITLKNKQQLSSWIDVPVLINLNESVVFKGVGWYFSLFPQILIKHMQANSEGIDQTPHYVVPDRGCTVCPCAIKGR